MTTHPGLRLDRDDDVLTITLCNGGRRNPQTPTMWAALAEIAENLEEQVRIVVLRAEGPDFSTGLDRKMLSLDGMPGEPNLLGLAKKGAEPVAGLIADLQRGFTAWAACPAIVIAAVQGHAIGAGFQLALAADMRLVTADVKFAMRETSLGLVPDLGGTLPLVRTVGYSRAFEWCLTGRFVEAQEAISSGLATLAVANDMLEEVTAQVIEALLQTPRQASRELKALLRQAVDANSQEQLRAEREAQARLLATIAEGRPQL